MYMPHEEYCLVFCPKLCPYKEFWKTDKNLAESKTLNKYIGEPYLKWFLNLAPTRCIEDKTIEDAIWVWQELYYPGESKELKAQEIHEEIQKWIDTTIRLAIVNKVDCNPSINPLSVRNDKYTKVVGIALSKKQVQIYFQRICPIWLLMKFAKDVMNIDISTKVSFDKFMTDFSKIFNVASDFPKTSDRFTERVEGMIYHLRWDTKSFSTSKGSIACNKYFEGCPSFVECEEEHFEFLNFIKMRFSEWRHLE